VPPRLALPLAGIVAVAAGIGVAILTSAGDPYPLPDGTGAAQWNPVGLGAPTQAVVLSLEPRPGDRIELLGAEAIGLPPAVRPTLYLSRPVMKPDGVRLIGEKLEPIAGAVIEAPAGASPGPDNSVAIVAEMTPALPGTYQLTGIRVRFRTNGGVEQVREGITTLWTVCAADPPPDCEPPDGTDP
jgi:hypothetical protein